MRFVDRLRLRRTFFADNFQCTLSSSLLHRIHKRWLSTPLEGFRQGRSVGLDSDDIEREAKALPSLLNRYKIALAVTEIDLPRTGDLLFRIQEHLLPLS